MDPKDFRTYSAGIRCIAYIANNEFRAFARNKGVLLSMVMSPLITYGLLVLTLSQSIPEVNYHGLILGYSQYALLGVMSFFLTTQMSQAMYRATIDKTYGLLAYKFLNGVQPWHYLVGMSVFPIVGFLFQVFILILIALPTGGVVELLPLIYAVGIFIVGLLFWTTIGVLLSARINSYEQRDMIMTVIFSPLAYASPALYVVNEHSHIIIRILAAINPLSYQLEAVRSVAYGLHEWQALLIAIAITVVALIAGQIILSRMQLKLEEH